MKKNLQTVVIVGRINVGKSSLFNRLSETGRAIVSDVPGTTRDYNTNQVNWARKTFSLIDTGGVNIENLKNSIQVLLAKKPEKKLARADVIEKAIIKQTKEALKKADLILMVVDGQAGLLPEDKELALVLKKINKPIILACNKIDNQKYRHQANEFFKLGLGQPQNVSAINGSGSGDLLDFITKKIKGQVGRPTKKIEPKTIKVAIIGKPNVGKSSLLNKILGEERVIVTPVAQTTREPQDIQIDYQGKKITLIDTAGLRRQARVDTGIERLANRRSLITMRQADIVLFVTQADLNITTQDNRLAGLVKESGTSIILLANKWDLVQDKTTKIDKQMHNYYQMTFPYLSFAPLIFVSAKTGKNVDKILDLIIQVEQERKKEIDQTDLNRILSQAINKHLPAQAKGKKHPFIYSLTQTKVDPPEFTIITSKDDTLHFSYIRFIENQIRRDFDFIGTPIKIKVTQTKRKK